MLLLWVALPFVVAGNVLNSPAVSPVFPQQAQLPQQQQQQPAFQQSQGAFVNSQTPQAQRQQQQEQQLQQRFVVPRRTEPGAPRPFQFGKAALPAFKQQQQQLGQLSGLQQGPVMPPPPIAPGKARFGGDADTTEEATFHVNVGTTPGGKDVIEDDNVNAKFDNEMQEDSEIKELYIVPTERLFTTFYVSRDDHADYNNARLLAQRASIVVEGRDVVAKLGQSWVMLDEVPSITNTSAPPLSFTIQYECLNQASPNIEVKMRLFQVRTDPTTRRITRAIKEVTFDFIKQCAKITPQLRHSSGNANPGFHVGLTPTGSDVIEDGIARQQFSIGALNDMSNVFTVGADKEKIDFWIRGPPGMQLNAPFVYVRNQKVLQAQGIGLDDGVALEAAKAYAYGVKFLCVSEGESMLTIVFSAKSTTFRRTFFTFKKLCVTPQNTQVPASGVVVQGFSVAAEWGGQKHDLISDGAVHDLFKTTANIEQEEGLQRPVIPHDVGEVAFTVRLKENNLKLKVPWVQSFPFHTEERINKPQINVEKKKFKHSSVEKPGEFSVVFNCKTKGISNNVISLRVSGEEVVFVVRKECGEGDITHTKDTETPDAPLYKITGLNIGTHKYGTDVVKDGITTQKYNWDTPWQNVHVVGVNDSFFTLFLWRNKTANPRPIRLDTPELSSTLEISEPQIGGSGSDGDVLDAEHPTSFISVNFHCMQEGTTHFNMIIPFLPYDTSNEQQTSVPPVVTATPAITAATTPASRRLFEEVEEEEDEEDEVVVPKTRRTRAKKVAPTPEPEAEEEEQEVAPTPKPRPKTKRIIRKQTDAEGDEAETVKSTPTKKKATAAAAVRAEDDEDVEAAEVSAKKRKEDASTATVQKKKKAPATTVEADDEGQADADEPEEVQPPKKAASKRKPVPAKKVYEEAPERPLTEPIRDLPIRITFIKQCPAPSAAAQQKGLGGMFIPGLTVCYRKNCADDSYVVYNGFPLTAFFGQRTVRDPQWRIVPEDQESTDLYISYNSMSEDKEEYENDVVEFEAPILIKDNTLASPELSGEAVEGGTLAKDGEALELGITYNCEFAGLVAVTVMLPIVPHGEITFTFPKQCRGATKFVGVRMPGLRIGTVSGEADVVMNGFTQEQFQPFLAVESANRKRIYADSTTFYISHVSGRPVKMLEPTVFAHRGMANPYISHNMHINKGQNEAEDLDMVVVGPEEQTFEVIYNCVFNDETAITVSFPLETKDRISFSFVKVCGQDEDEDFFAGLQDDEISQWQLEDEEEGNLGARDDSIWDQWDEVRWNPDPEQTSQKEGGEKAAGYVDIGTTSTLADVVSGGVASPAYSLPTAQDTTESATIGRGSNLATYYIYVPQGFQQIGPPIFRTLKGNEGQDIVLPRLTGTAMAGGELRGDGPAAVLTVEFNCQTTGVTPILISVPLVPANLGAASFRVVKICGAFNKSESFAFTANNVLALLGGMIVLIGLCLAFIYKQGKSGEPVKYSRVTQRD